MTTIKTLILDNEDGHRELFAEILSEDGHEVHCAKNLAEAQEQLRIHSFHLALIDIQLDGNENGLRLLDDIKKLNRETNAFCAPIVFTGFSTKERVMQALDQGVLGFREKPVNLEDFILSKMGRKLRGYAIDQDLLDVSRKVLRKVLSERNHRYSRRKHTVSFHLQPGQKTRVELTGPTAFVSESSNTLEVDIDDFSDRTDDLQFHFNQTDSKNRSKWRTRAKKLGEGLYGHIFGRDTELSTCLSTARERSDKNPLHMVFRGSQDILRLPVELLPGEVGQLITDYPLSRQIAGIRSVRNPGIESLFEDDVDPIKVLLIGANTLPEIPGVDEEILCLERKLSAMFSCRGLNSQIQVVPSQEADYDTICSYLDRCSYHIVHYAGHGYHDDEDTDESGLFFWEKPNQSGTIKPMPIRKMRNLLRGSDVRFFYLSCCVGAKTAGAEHTKLKGNDFQGILEGLVRVGIPSVLGFRWNVWDTDAQHFASSFYESLFTDFSLDVATFKARRALQEQKYYSETWASPVLVMQ